MAVKQISNPQAAFGLSGDESYFQVVVPFEAGGTITAGQCLEVGTVTDETLPTVIATDAVGAVNVIGIAKNAAAAGEIVEVVVHGYAVADAAAGLVAGAILESTAAGAVDDGAGDTTGAGIGLSLSAVDVPSSGKAVIWVFRS